VNHINDHFKSPAWHGDILRKRVEAAKSGEETFIDWEEAKKELRKLTRETPEAQNSPKFTFVN